MQELVIEGRKVGFGEPVFIIGEVGVNHNGNIELAHEMIDVAADTGCDCVKFQTFTADEFCNNPDDIYEYISQGKVIKEPMIEMFRRFELNYDEFEELFHHARQRKIIPLSTPTDKNAVLTLNRLNCQAFKIGSDDLVYTPFLRLVADQGKPIIISTGMAELEDIERAIRTIENTGNDQIIILHCISEYPTPISNAHLNRITYLQKKYREKIIGFSDHSSGITASIGAVAKGAKVIEKHFTLDNNFEGPDHHFSSNPTELVNLVNEIRHIEKALGSSEFYLTEQDTEMAKLCHRSIYTNKNLVKGHRLTKEDLNYQRPGIGLMPYHTDNIVGRTLNRNLKKGAVITLESFETDDK